MRSLTLILVSLAMAAGVYSQESPPLRRHQLSTDVLRLAARQPNLRYGYRLFASGEIFTQAVAVVEERTVSTGRVSSGDYEELRRFDLNTQLDLYLGYRHSFGRVESPGRVYLEGALGARLYGDLREEYVPAQRSASSDFLACRSLTAPIAVTSVGYSYGLRGGWLLDARLSTSAVLERQVCDSTILPFGSQWGYAVTVGGRASGALTIGKRF